MAGAIKHMERSRRSHRTDNNMFVHFHRHAYAMKQAKESRMTVGQKLSNVFKKMLPEREDN